MTTTTPVLGLVLYNSTTDNTATFLSYRIQQSGPAGSSNMYLIDSGFLADRARLTVLEALKFVNIVHATFSSGSTYLASPSTISSYIDQTIIALDIDTTNSGVIQLNLNSLGLRSLVKKDSTGASVNLAAGDLVKNRIYFFKYDIASTSFVWMAGTSGDQLNVPGTTGNIATVTSSGGLDGSTTQSLLLSQTVHAATGKTVPASLDEFGIVDTAASNVLKKITWANLQTNFTTALGALIAAATNKSVPIGADLLGLADSASSNATKNTTLTQLFNQFGVLSHAWTQKTSIVGADESVIGDSAASFANKRVLWSDIIISLKTLIAVDTWAVATNVTTSNVTSSAHGFAPVAPADATKFLNGAATPAYAQVKDSDLSTTNIATNNATNAKHGFLPILSGNTADTFRGDGTYGGIYAPEGFLQNGQINVTVVSNNITVAIKTLAGANPSATDPVYIRLNGAIRSITSALSVTKNAGTNWFASGGSPFATLEIDYFVYLGYNSTDGVVIGFSRIPYARQYSTFSATSTNETYCAISTITTAAATDYYSVIGRFAATLSATASFNWSVPTFTATNLVNYPIYQTRWLSWLPTYTASGSLTYSSVSTDVLQYNIDLNITNFQIEVHGTTGGTTSNQINASLPMGYVGGGNPAFAANIVDGSGAVVGAGQFSATNLVFSKFDNSNWGLGASRYIIGGGLYRIN